MKARLMTSDELAKAAAKRWDEQYSPDYRRRDPAKAEISRQLNALTNPEPHVIAAIIGNTGWCEVSCDGCGWCGYGTVVQVGMEQDYDSNTANLCAKCIAEAAALTHP